MSIQIKGLILCSPEKGFYLYAVRGYRMDFPVLMADCAPGVSAQTMAAIVQQESGFNPYAIGVNGDYILERQPQTKEEAINVISWLEQEGQTNLDLGIAQISKKNRAFFNLSINDSLDACSNISVGAKILSDNYTRALSTGLSEQDALRAAISEYNTGSKTAGFSNGYVQKVVNNTGENNIIVPDIITTVKTNSELGSAQQPQKEYPEQVHSIINYPEQKENIYAQQEGMNSLFVYEVKQ